MRVKKQATEGHAEPLQNSQLIRPSSGKPQLLGEVFLLIFCSGTYHATHQVF